MGERERVLCCLHSAYIFVCAGDGGVLDFVLEGW